MPLNNVLSYGIEEDNNLYSILDNIFSKDRDVDSTDTIDNVVYISSYKTILDFGKIFYHYRYCKDKGNINNIFIGVDYTACNISAIFNPGTILGKKNRDQNVYERYYFRKYTVDSMNQPTCLYQRKGGFDRNIFSNSYTGNPPVENFCNPYAPQAPTTRPFQSDDTGVGIDEIVEGGDESGTTLATTFYDRVIRLFGRFIKFRQFGKRIKRKINKKTNNKITQIDLLIKLVKKF